MLSDHSLIKTHSGIDRRHNTRPGVLGLHLLFSPCVFLSLIVFIRTSLSHRLTLPRGFTSKRVKAPCLWMWQISEYLCCCRMINHDTWRMAVNTHSLCSSDNISLWVLAALGCTRHHGEGETFVNYRSYEGRSALYKISTDYDCVKYNIIKYI